MAQGRRLFRRRVGVARECAECLCCTLEIGGRHVARLKREPAKPPNGSSLVPCRLPIADTLRVVWDIMVRVSKGLVEQWFFWRSRRGWTGFLAVFLFSSAGVFVWVMPAMAAPNLPEVGYRAASNVSSTGATIEVPINPEGAETSYEISLQCQSVREDNQDCEPLTVGSQSRQGVLLGGFEQQIVTDTVTGLQPSYLYQYSVIATNSAGREGYVGNGFITCPSQGLCPRQPYLEGAALWSIEGGRRVAEEAPRVAAEERVQQKEAEERPAREAAEQAAKERVIHEAGERAGREVGERAGREAAERAASTRSPRCVVPSLKGDSLTQARRALDRAHCSLGKLSEPRRYHGPLVVVKQSAQSGRRLPADASVALILNRPHKP